ncbi:MAG: glyoxylate/hydroxypyruvate reductase A [Hyphomicrobiaceae bacterium]|nr:glyoxylate/hydroxypyruvate reductase A [Hyphomicrobiaceae bacterium]
MALLIIGSQRSEEFASAAREQVPDLDIRIWPDTGPVEDIRYALAWGPPVGALKRFPGLELIISVGAGVDHLMKDPELPGVPVVRYVDPDLTGRMVGYIALNVLMHLRRMSEYLEQQRQRTWRYLPEPAAHEVRVGLMGLGVMGKAAAKGLEALGCQLRGWSRTQKTIEGVECFAGQESLDAFLSGTDILVCTLPLTPDTRGIINRDLMRKLSRHGRHRRMPGPVLINAGRGALQIEADILAALDAGELYAASLDVFETEPLPASSPLWSHPRVVITPHNAAESTPEAISRYMLRQIARHRAGLPLENIVDPVRGY